MSFSQARGVRNPLFRFVPSVAVEWDQSAPNHHTISGTLVFVDISGFTELSERLADKGRIGAEELTGVLNDVFGTMIEGASTRGGSLIKFGGDALCLLFQEGDHALQATAATIEMRNVLRHASGSLTDVGRISLRMSSGVHTGEFDFFLVGDARQELILSGPGVSEVICAEGVAGPGQIVVTSATMHALPAEFTRQQSDGHWIIKKRKVSVEPIERARYVGVERPPEQLVPAGLQEVLEADAIETEHRPATVAFIGFDGIDEMLRQRGPSTVAEALDAFVTTAQTAAAEHGVVLLGSDVAVDGGKLILTAGVPTARLDDDGRMLRTVRAVLDAPSDLELRAGISRGHVFSGAVGSSLRGVYTVMGDTVNTAARLASAAEPGSLVATPGVLDRASTLYRTSALEPLLVKGKAMPIHAFEVFEETGRRPRVDNDELEFRGRSTEFDRILSAINRARQSGQGARISITGPTGIGKSRLTNEALSHSDTQVGLVVLAEPAGVDEPYWAFRDPLRDLLGLKGAAADRIASAFRHRVEGLDPALHDMIPLLAEVAHVDIPDNSRTEQIDPQFRQARTGTALVELLDHVGSPAKTLVVEDAHWLDEASATLVDAISRAAEDRPWTLLVTSRTHPESSTTDIELALTTLDEEAVRAICIEATRAAPLRPHELDTIVSRADGNPLFLAEVLRLVRETGNTADLPESLNEVVLSDIDSISGVARTALKYASILGRSFRKEVATELLSTEKVPFDDDILGQLRRFVEVDGDRIRFRNAVTHEAAYESLSFKRRRELHARAATAIEQIVGTDADDVAGRLAEHYFKSGQHEQAWKNSLIAGDRSRIAYANSNAAAHYQRAIQAARRTDVATSSDVAGIWTSLGELYDLMGDYVRARHAYGEALDTIEDNPAAVGRIQLLRAEAWFGEGNLSAAKRNVTLGKKVLVGRRESANLPIRAELEAYLASIHAAAGDPVSALRAAAEAASLAKECDAKEALARAYRILDWARFALGIEEPRRGPEAIAILQNLGQFEKSVAVLNNMGVFAHLQGNWNEAIDWYQKGVEAAEMSGNVVEAARTTSNIAELMIAQRRYSQAVPLLEESERVLAASDVSELLPWVRLQKARASLGLGDTPGAVGILRDLFDTQMTSGDTSEDPEIVVHLAEALIEDGRIEEALETLDRYADVARENAELVGASMARVRGVALWHAGLAEESRNEFKSALALALNEADTYQEALVREAMATYSLSDGEVDLTNLEQMTTLFETLGITEVYRQPVPT